MTILISLFLAGTVYAQMSEWLLDPNPLRRMTEEEARVSGVHRLSPDQKTTLGNRLQSHFWMLYFRQRDQRDSHPCEPAVHGNIDGTFRGWRGDTLVRLGDGSVWEQTEYSYTYEYDYSPDVVVFATSFGHCAMIVEGSDEWIEVRRLKAPRLARFARITTMEFTKRLCADRTSSEIVFGLSDTECAALSRWILHYASVMDAMHRQERRDCTPSFSESIGSDFDGWTGGTLVRLRNGSVWEQTGGGSVSHRGYTRDVAVFADAVSGCAMFVTGTDEWVRVERLK